MPLHQLMHIALRGESWSDVNELVNTSFAHQ
jgi:hypothetical protein